MTVRSTQLFLGPVTAVGSVVLYTVPSGFRTIVKEIRSVNVGVASQWGFGVIPSGGGGGTLLGPFSAAAAPALSALVLSCWIVLDAGEQLYITSTPDTTFHVAVSGAELEL